MNWTKLVICVGLVGTATGCGPHQGANVKHFVDCIGDGCDTTYQEKVDEFRGSSGEQGTQGVQGIPGTEGTPGLDGVAGTKGSDGADGIDGLDGQDAVIYITTVVLAGNCSEVAPGIWVENIRNGKLLDVYYNDTCSDASGEYCDNLVPSESRTGRLKAYKGSGTVCWAESTQISASKLDNGAVKVHLLNFAQGE